MSELNRDQIVKALECCCSYCDKENCPYKTHDIPIACMTMRMVDALTLIKQLTEENERLKEKADRHLDNLKAVLDERAEAKTEVAKQIFEEIEKPIFSQLGISTMEKKEAYCFCLDTIAELKKKYIGG